MNKATKNYISSLANAVRETYQLSIPIDETQLVRAVNEMGGRIETVEDINFFYEGTIKKDGENSFILKITENPNEKRKIFTIAHELGHLFLHMGYKLNNEVWKSQDEKLYTRFGQSEQEVQANEFAAALLMPEADFIGTIYENNENGNVNMKKIADKYNVSLSTATTRGRLLEIIV